MTTDPSSPSRTDWAITCVLLAAFFGAYFYLFGWQWHSDMSAIYYAGHFWASGEFDQIYAAPDRFFGVDVPEAWQAFGTELGIAPEYGLPYAYPPIWAALLSPAVEQATPHSFMTVTLLVQIVLLAACIPLTWDIFGRPIELVYWTALSLALLLTGQTALIAISLNQPQMTVTFLTVLSVHSLMRGRAIGGGILLALATAIKLTPILLVVALIVTRQGRALLAFSLTLAVLAGVSFAICGPDLIRAFLAQLALLSQQVMVIEINLSIPSILQAMWPAPVTEFLYINDYTYVMPAAMWARWIASAILAAAVLWTIAATVRRPPFALPRAIAALTIAGAATGPLGWAHYYLLPLLFLPGLAAIFPRRESLVILFLLVAAFSMTLSDVIADYVPHPLATTIWPMLVWGLCLALFLRRGTTPLRPSIP